MHFWTFQISADQAEVFTNSLQHKNANIANFVQAMPFKLNKTNRFFFHKLDEIGNIDINGFAM